MPTLKKMYEEWVGRRTSKSAIERRYLGTGRQHGKLFTRLVRDYLGEDTERPHPLKSRVHELELENERLKGVLREHGLSELIEGSPANKGRTRKR